MRSPLVLLLILLTSLLPALAAADRAEETRTLELHGGQWVAWRFRLVPGADLVITADYRGCDPEEGFAEMHAFVAIRNGAIVTPLYEGMGPGLWSEAVDAGVGGNALRVRPDLSPAGFVDGQCSGDWFAGAGARATDEELTLLFLNSAPYGFLNLTASWTHGIVSNDLRTGAGTAKALSDFSQGVSASVWGVAPVGTAGALLHESVETNGIGLGWWLPQGGLPPEAPTGVTLHSCKQNGTECSNAPTSPYGTRWLSARGQTTWDFDAYVKAQAMQQPWRVLGVFDIPAEYAPSGSP